MKYQVTLVDHVYANVEVEAANEEEAKEKALNSTDEIVEDSGTDSYWEVIEVEIID